MFIEKSRWTCPKHYLQPKSQNIFIKCDYDSLIYGRVVGLDCFRCMKNDTCTVIFPLDPRWPSDALYFLVKDEKLTDKTGKSAFSEVGHKADP